MPHDYYEPKLADEPINVALNEAIERAAAGKAELPRSYLGASIVGSDCLRRVQYDWWCTPTLDARTRAIFARGHYLEARVREQLVAAGLKFAPPEALVFTAVNGDLRGHADGIITAGPNPLGSAYVNYPFLWGARRSMRKTTAPSRATDSKGNSPDTRRSLRSIRAISS